MQTELWCRSLTIAPADSATDTTTTTATTTAAAATTTTAGAAPARIDRGLQQIH